MQIVSGLSVFALSIAPVWGQITPISDTTVHSTPDGAHINVTGGVSSADGTNLFHQFETFNVNTPETVNFVAPATVKNILSRISGGQISTIDGGLAVSNDANLWLINSTGIVFGPHAHLNLQGDFTAATADAVEFENGWFTDGTDYQTLVGPPLSFTFISSPGNLINLGNLEVDLGQNLTLLGDSVVNAGNLNAPAGTVTIAAVANTNRVKLSQIGQLLTLEIEPWADVESSTQLPNLLTGQGTAHADTLALAADGTIYLSQSIPGLTPEAGLASISGRVHSTGDHGGQIAILGERVSLVGADINVNGLYRGGDIYIGGNYQGTGPLPNATHTDIDQASILSANALHHGDGGQIVVWADQATSFGGTVQAQGGELGGNGGFIEISGKSKLGFTGNFSVSAPHGEFGTILFDPDNIQIVDGSGTANGDIELSLNPFGTVIADDGDGGWFTISEGTLEGWDGNANIVLQANNDIFIQNLGGDNTLTFQPGSGSISFIADADNDGAGQFSVAHAGDLIDTAGRDITISGYTIDIEFLDTSSATGTGDVTLIAQNRVRVNETLTADNISIQGDAIDLSGGNASISGNTLSLQPWSPEQDIDIGATTNNGALNLVESDIRALKDGFTNISIGRSDSTGNVILLDAVTDGGAAAFKDPVTILGANELQGPAQLTTWAINGNNQGNLDSLFSNGLTFENVNSIAASNNTSDILQGTEGHDTITLTSNNSGTFKGIAFRGIHNIRGAGGDDTVIFGNGVAELSGSIDGGGGNNTLDYQNYIPNVVVDLETIDVSGTGGFSNIQKIIGSSGSFGGFGPNVIQGTSGTDEIILTGNGVGTINGLAFQEFTSVVPADGNDRIFVNGGTWSSIDGGAGTDTLDYSSNSTVTGITIDLENQTIDNVTAFTNIEDFKGSSGEDTLRGTGSNDVISITGDNAGKLLDTTGTLGPFTFSEIENIEAGAGDDQVAIAPNGNLSGTLDAGDGIDSLDYSAYTTTITVDLNNNSATAINGLNKFERITGGSGNDTFRLSAANTIDTLEGGAGSDTLEGDTGTGVWNLTAVNAGNGTGVNNFSNIENLMAGDQADQINVLASGAQLTEVLDGGDGALTITGDTIDIGTGLKGTGELILQPFTANRDIQLGGADSTSALAVSAAEISNIHPGFTGITIGRSDGTHTITLGSDVTFLAPTTIQTPNGDGAINAQAYNLEAPQIALLAAQNILTGSLTATNDVTLQSSNGAINTQGENIEASHIRLFASQDIFAANLTAAGGVSLKSDASIHANNITTSSVDNGGGVDLNAGATITTQQINTTGLNGIGGDVTLSSVEDIEVASIRAEGNAAGGSVDITTNEFFRATDSFIALGGSAASISTAAFNGTGSITIRHTGNGSTPFNVGNSNLLGSHAALTSGDLQIEPGNSFLNSHTLGNIAILTQDVISPVVVDPPSIAAPIHEETPNTSFNSPLIENSAFTLDNLSESVESDSSNKALFERLENSYSEQFKSHLNLYERVSLSPTNLETAQQTLENVEALTGVKPGVLYVYFLPTANKDTAAPESTDVNPDDELGVLLLTHNGQTIRKKIDGITRSDVMAVAADFSAQVTNAISSPSQYLPPAQQLYEWFITPVEDILQQQQVQSLALAMDTGLRTLPVAALHDGHEFFVERYSLGVIPSFSLTDFNPQNFLYTQLEQTPLLAMGASQFPSQQLLPAVPEELTIITQAFHDSEIFINEDFTLNNLQHQVGRNEFGIVHLASHGVFEPGAPSQSYIQLWDQPLQLDQIHTLGLQEANIALMVLSACNTALGDREAEYGFAGLAVNAGVQTSVASLWPISDEGTLGLMTYFYQHLQQQPVRAIALREAQLAMLRGDLQFTDGTLYGLDQTPLAHFPELEYHGRWNFEHPFYWSTYTLVGSPW